MVVCDVNMEYRSYRHVCGCARSLGSTVRRLSDVREDDAAVDQGIPVGDLDALLPDLPEAEEPQVYTPGDAPAVRPTLGSCCR